LAVVSSKFNRLEWISLKEDAYYDVKTILQISIVNFISNPTRLQERIIKNGMVIYER